VSDTVVLANAHDAARLCPEALWPLRLQRGQVSQISASACGTMGQSLPKCPIVGQGYVVPLPDGGLLVGATHQWDDMDASLREDDHRANLALLPQLLGYGGAIPQQVVPLDGRVGWRCVSPDRLPLAGRVADSAALQGLRVDNVRQVPRIPGLWVLTALGSRGIASAALGGALVAAGIQGAPAPVSRELIDALDPARFAVRSSRRSFAPFDQAGIAVEDAGET
jgi:tRNA 5-methylaminomethyl-2-thiouridine biosynthesis bifunctional protein